METYTIHLLSTCPVHIPLSTMRDEYIKAVAYGDICTKRIFTHMSELFVREPTTNEGLGAYYLVDLVTPNGTCCGTQVVSVFCENHDIPVCIVDKCSVPIRDVVNTILVTSPPRCAIIIDTRNNDLMKKVRARIANTHCDLRYRRIIFCLTNQNMPSGSSITSIVVPGSIDDKMSMLLYHIPPQIQNQAPSLECFRPLANAMFDYALFQPRVWSEVHMNGTLNEFLSSAMYQIVRRVRTDPGIGDDYPSFETHWRSVMATTLKNALGTPPDALCPSIHRVIPIGVLPQDAIQAMTVAIPKDIKNPYSITVQSSAVDDRCGSIAITQPMHFTVVNVNCLINPGLLVDVCRELRAGHRAVVSEVHSMSMQLKKLVERLDSNNDDIVHTDKQFVRCKKRGCTRPVTKQFRSGKLYRQCTPCIENA
jgi:hypothetical protein